MKGARISTVTATGPSDTATVDLPSLELACLAELAPHLPARYRDTCAKMERDAQGRIVMPPPDIAPARPLAMPWL